MPRYENIQCILFDVDQTLIDLYSILQKALHDNSDRL